MRILILHQFFYPDHSAVSQLMTDLAESLVERGVEVTAVAGRGRYNGGERLSRREEYQGIKIERAWATSFGKRSIAGRLADYLSFYVGATWKLLRVERHDILLALTQPPLIGLIGLLIGRLRGMRVVALVQDVYPDVAVAVGALKERSLGARFFDFLNRRALRGMDRIIVLGECMRDRIIAKVGAERASRIDIIHNWADGQLIKPLANAAANPFRLRHNLERQFVVLFSGNFGLVNEFQTALEAARLLRERKDITFLFVGDGVRADEIKEHARRHQLENIRMLPYQPRADLCFSLTAGDAHLTTLAEGLAGLSVPSKTYAILAAGRPVLFVGDVRSAVAKLVAENDCGAVVASGQPEQLAQVITEWAANPARLVELGARARALFESRFERQHAITAYLASFEKCLNDEKDNQPMTAEAGATQSFGTVKSKAES
ncbi:MAG: colanic acid biosynthesis glycosyl transferase WcaI [Blastocatellia bacterium]|jgi:glycosyltransferase involved in cell wall biosynthesis|nr:colanic acid biosynthesis glycosyl transferase WcaI [Blastocatellia bacterium]